MKAFYVDLLNFYYSVFISFDTNPGTTMVRASVVKDNHIFTVHLLNPYEQTEEELDLDIKTSRQQKPEGIEKADFEISEKSKWWS